MGRPCMDAKAVLANADNLINWAKKESERIRPEVSTDTQTLAGCVA